MMKLIKKHAGGGWLKDKSGKDRIGYWDYSDGPKDIQKKIARYYADLVEENEGDNESVTTYLNTHPDLANYLDGVYAHGIDWKGQEALGNTDNGPKYLSYRNSKGTVNFTKRGDNRETYAKNLGYKSYTNLLNTLKAAGFKSDEAGTAISISNGTSPSYMFAAEDSNGDFYFVDTQGRARTLKKKKDMEPIVKRHRAYLASQAKKAALGSTASDNWAALGDWLGFYGHFYDKMIAAGYKYDPGKGTYSKGNDIYYINDSLQVSKASKAKPNQKVIVQKLKFF